MLLLHVMLALTKSIQQLMVLEKGLEYHLSLRLLLHLPIYINQKMISD